MSVEVISPGLFTTVQDLGRYGYQRHGVHVSGAMDALALRVANLLVGNEPDAAVLELTMKGPALRFHQDVLVAVCGADMQPVLDERRLRRNRPVLVQSGSVLCFGHAREGCRAYLAIAGGFDVPLVMNSRSTNVRAKFGGAWGRALAETDRLALGKPGKKNVRLARQLQDRSVNRADSFCEADWFVPQSFFPYPQQKDAVVRVMPGAESELFTAQSRRDFWTTPYQISVQSDRMGYRLHGPELALNEPVELISSAVSAGTIQVPPSGMPIVLLADRQTVGGYPKIGHVATADLPILAQLRPHDRVQFQQVTLRAAQQAWYEQEKALAELGAGIELYLGGRSKR
ncbi:biotin-dependent carboxyltransferase family protein [Brevibacillus parabrevis]|uniref:5-oxoprolinase subunit C family protein n=1 Tax=Brevibacillus parabrevis TaxID=54914 RepID=UPI0028D16602|nr:biotin-dependent carboxyltransferase family protein [Brevibacillus parabrevis]MED1724395.1 biotin-dependent carboxyltransferase family protein [Brevibacillus parabrevis]